MSAGQKIFVIFSCFCHAANYFVFGLLKDATRHRKTSDQYRRTNHWAAHSVSGSRSVNVEKRNNNTFS